MILKLANFIFNIHVSKVYGMSLTTRNVGVCYLEMTIRFIIIRREASNNTDSKD